MASSPLRASIVFSDLLLARRESERGEKNPKKRAKYSVGLSIVLADKSHVLAIRPGQFKSSIMQG